MVASPKSAKAFARLACREGHTAPSELLHQATSLKRQQLDAERLLWNCLKNRQLDGYEFSRREDLGAFVADFFCVRANLIVKLGDDQSRRERAPICDRWARANNFRVIRVHRAEVEHNIEQVLNVITIVLKAASL